MRTFLTLFVLLAAIVIGHLAVLYGAPGFIMQRAMAAMEQRGIPQHGFRLAPRMTPQTQRVVRASPELAYSICLFDFSEGVDAVAIEMAAWPGYSSLSVYDAQTNNFLTFRGEGKRFAMRLLPPLSEPEGFSIPAPTQRGVVLIRRIAPNEADYRAVEKIAAEDSCRAIRGGNAR